MKIEINIGKRHFWALVGIIVLLFGVTAVIAKTTTPAYTDDQPYHGPLYADVIAAKTSSPVTIAGIEADIVTIDDHLKVTGAIDGLGIVPEGFCVFSDVNAICPAGWTRKTTFDGKTIKGSLTPGETGGSDTHAHSLYAPTGYSYQHGSGSNAWSSGIWWNTEASASWPPYVGVTICCRESPTTP